MIDTHSHVYEPEFDQDREQVIRRALECGVEKILLPNINISSIPRMMETCAQYPDICHPMMGLHPEDVKEDWQQILDSMELLLKENKDSATPYIAVGEIGLDFYWDKTYANEQIMAFERQLEWAQEYNLPVVIHTRKAEQELIQVMKRHDGAGLRGIFHCFGGSKETARELLRFQGFYLGIGGVVTFRNSHLQETLLEVPMERIVLETDDPYLTPHPHRGTRNEPAYTRLVAEKLSAIYNISLDDVIRQTNINAKNIFRTI